MFEAQPSQVKVTLACQVDINGTEFNCAGTAFGAPGLGNLVATVVSDRDLPRGFDMSLLTYVCLTGDPPMGRVLGAVSNPFAEKRVFRACRTLDLGTHGSLTTTWEATEPTTGRREDFSISGTVNVPKLVSLEPTVETWTPVGPGRFDGRFELAWRDADGNVIRGTAISEYYLPDGYELPQQMYRDIRFAIRSDGRRLWQTEHIVIFGHDLMATDHDAAAPSIEDAYALA